MLNETFSVIFKHYAVFQNCSKSLSLQQYHFRYFFDSFQSKNSDNLIVSTRVSKNSFFLASSGGRSPKQSVSESLPDEDQEDAAATSPKPKVDEASKKGQSHQKSTFHNTYMSFTSNVFHFLLR